MSDFSLKLVKKTWLNNDVVTLNFSKPEALHFKAGQFLQFVVPNGEKPAMRAYSIASTPQDEEIQFCIKIVPEGLASTWFKHMELGTECTVKGPRGMFSVGESSETLKFIATGTGIAPVMGIIRDELQKGSNRAMDLLFGLRSEKDLFWQDEFSALADEKKLAFRMTLSQPQTESWAGLSGRVTSHLTDIDLSARYFLCGSAPMVKEVRGILLEAGVDKKHIHFEIF